MEKTEARIMLERMRAALKEGRGRRKEDKKWACVAQGDVFSSCATETDVDQLKNYIQSRGMQANEGELGPNGRKLIGVVNIWKREKYQKRPSVRAARMFKAKGRGLGI
jgi:hypothetical protein